jgi:hypothetical protein
MLRFLSAASQGHSKEANALEVTVALDGNNLLSYYFLCASAAWVH